MTIDKLEKLNSLNERIKKLTEQIQNLKELLSDEDNIYSNSFVVRGRVKNSIYALKVYEIELAKLQKEFDEL